MKGFPHPATICLLLVTLTACTSAPKPTVLTQMMQPTQGAIPTDLAFATPLVQLLSGSGLSILSVQDSIWNGFFQSTNNAVWIKTDQGIVEAVFFADPAEVKQIQVTQQPSETAGRYLYKIQASPSTLSHAVTIDAAFPLYFTMERDLFMVTSSAELDQTLKHIFSEP